MNRGSPSNSGPSAASITCFNEAPIHESGKSYPARLQAHLAERFNEAPIHESGK